MRGLAWGKVGVTRLTFGWLGGEIRNALKVREGYVLEFLHDGNLPPNQTQRITSSRRQPCFPTTFSLIIIARRLFLLSLPWPPTLTRILVQILLLPQPILGKLFQSLSRIVSKDVPKVLRELTYSVPVPASIAL